MKIKRELYLRIGIFLICFIVLSLNWTATPAKAQVTCGGTKAVTRDGYLLVTLEQVGRDHATDTARTRQNSKFDNWGWVRPTVHPDGVSVTLVNDWQIRVPALPVEKSDAVVIGTVESGKAFMSNDGTGVNSEFPIVIDKWLKGKPSGDVQGDGRLVLQRPGGRVLYPSGHILTYSISGQGMPELHGKYVLFLNHVGPEPTFRILTGYKFEDGRVRPLDGEGRSKVSGFDFSEFEGADERSFTTALDIALKASNR